MTAILRLQFVKMQQNTLHWLLRGRFPATDSEVTESNNLSSLIFNDHVKQKIQFITEYTQVFKSCNYTYSIIHNRFKPEMGKVSKSDTRQIVKK
jgi:hypothetical protein